MRRIGIALFALMLAASSSFAHYNMLLPDKPWANKDEKVTFTYQFGNPYEHELFDAPKPAALVVIPPKGKKEVLDIDKTLMSVKVDGADGRKVTAWRFDFTPLERGDFTFVLKTPKVKIDGNEFAEDSVRVVLHTQTQNGWETVTPPFIGGYEILPYTRPYGLLPGMVFRGRVIQTGVRDNGVGDAAVEIEKYNAKPTKNPHPNELITFRAKTDEHGYFVATLPEAGWWGVTGIIRDSGEKEKTTTLRRATMWIHVDEKK